MLLLLACVDAPDDLVQDESLHPCAVDAGDQELRLYDNDGALVVAWDSDEIWSLAVTSPDAKIGSYGRLESGRVSWSIAGEDFSELLVSPVFFGSLPAEAEDYTAYMGGVSDDLDTERCYEVQTSDLHHAAFGRRQFRLSELPHWMN